MRTLTAVKSSESLYSSAQCCGVAVPVWENRLTESMCQGMPSSMRQATNLQMAEVEESDQSQVKSAGNMGWSRRARLTEVMVVREPPNQHRGCFVYDCRQLTDAAVARRCHVCVLALDEDVVRAVIGIAT